MYYFYYVHIFLQFKIFLFKLLYLAACEADFTGGLLWPTSRRSRLVTQRCSEIHPSFRSGVMVSRQCGDTGDWSPVSIQDCTMFENSNPLVIVYFTVNTTTTNEASRMLTVENVSTINRALIHSGNA